MNNIGNNIKRLRDDRNLIRRGKEEKVSKRINAFSDADVVANV